MNTILIEFKLNAVRLRAVFTVYHFGWQFFLSFFRRILLAINNDIVSLMRISSLNGSGEQNAMHNMDATLRMPHALGRKTNIYFYAKNVNDLGSRACASVFLHI